MSKPFLSVFEMQALKASTKSAQSERVELLRAKDQKATAMQEFLTRLERTMSDRRRLERGGFVAMTLAALLLCSLPASADSLWKDDVARPLVADKRAVRVGDILTIIVQENTTTAKDQNTKSSKSSGVDASISSFLYPPSASGLLTKKGSLPAMKFDSKNEFSGGGAINNSEKIVAHIAVRVIDVLPNRNMVIEGTRETAFSGEQQTAILRGTVRPEDIAGNNTVFSYNIADATIKFVGKGAISDTQRKGWFTKVWDKLTPF